MFNPSQVAVEKTTIKNEVQTFYNLHIFEKIVDFHKGKFKFERPSHPTHVIVHSNIK